MQYSLWGPRWIVLSLPRLVAGWRTADRGLISTLLQALGFAALEFFRSIFWRAFVRLAN